jgi:hypothetical protein
MLIISTLEVIMGNKYTNAQAKATQNYLKDKTDLIRIRVPKGKKEEYQKLADRSGAKSLTAYITSLLESKLKGED